MSQAPTVSTAMPTVRPAVDPRLPASRAPLATSSTMLNASARAPPAPPRAALSVPPTVRPTSSWPRPTLMSARTAMPRVSPAVPPPTRTVSRAPLIISSLRAETPAPAGCARPGRSGTQRRASARAALRIVQVARMRRLARAARPTSSCSQGLGPVSRRARPKATSQMATNAPPAITRAAPARAVLLLSASLASRRQK